MCRELYNTRVKGLIVGGAGALVLGAGVYWLLTGGEEPSSTTKSSKSSTPAIFNAGLTASTL